MNAREPSPPAPADAVAGTLRPLLANQLARLRRRFLWHGSALTLALVAGAVLLFFLLDRTLVLPAPVRLFHAAVLVALGVAGVARFVRYPLSRHFGDVDLAVWFERTFPALHQRVVSAVQLHDLAPDALRNQSSAMIQQLGAETAAAVQALPLDQLFDRRPTTRAAGAASLLVTLLAAGAAWSPATARVFVLRHLGFAASYPRDTTLRIELPAAGPDLQRTDDGDTTELVLPSGADLHVSVLAEGKVPKEVFLDVRARRDDATGEERAIAMSPRPGDRFRHVFRRTSGSFQFHARGGDDEHGDRTVIVRTVLPPQVVSPRATIRPPAYTGIASIEQQGGAIEALVGSEVDLMVSTTTAVRSATMVFLESGRRLELTATTPQDDSGVSTSYRGSFVLEASDRYQIELVADNGLRNPNPGTYPIAALQDYAPVGRWLLPEDEGLLLLPTGILCLRVDAHDDFGLAAVELAVQRDGATVASRSLLPAEAPRTTAAVLTELIEVRDLVPADATGNEGLVLQLELRDNKQPQAGATALPRRIVQIADPTQLAAAIASLFRGLREEVDQARDVQADRRARLEDLAARTDVPPAELASILTGVEVGQSRVGSSIEHVHRGLMRAFDLHLWNRLGPSQNAAQVVEAYRARSKELREARALDPDFYRDLHAARAAGTLGAMEQTLDPILAMITLADGLGRGPAPDAAKALAEAQVARGAADRSTLLQRAIADQQQIETALAQLLLQLEEWNEFQDLVQEVRALRDRQRDLQDRTEDVRGKK